MRTIAQLGLWCVCAFAALGQGTFVTVPNGLAGVEGNSSMTAPFNSSSFRMQIVFDASQFAFLGSGTGRIDSISFRVDGGATNGGGYIFSGSTIALSTTATQTESLSPIFADNVGNDVTTIYNGPMSFGNIFVAGADPQPFSQTIVPTRSQFFYAPSRGNLVLDVTAGGGRSVFPGGLDAQATVGGGISRVYAMSELASSGIVDTLGLVARFEITPVPEPASWLIVCAGLFLALVCRRSTTRCKGRFADRLLR